MRQQAPLHHLRDALAIHRADGDQHRRRRRLIPIGLEVQRRRVGRELQLDFDFGVIGGETNTAAQIPNIAIHRALIEGHAQGRYREYRWPLLAHIRVCCNVGRDGPTCDMRDQGSRQAVD